MTDEISDKFCGLHSALWYFWIQHSGAMSETHPLPWLPMISQKFQAENFRLSWEVKENSWRQAHSSPYLHTLEIAQNLSNKDQIMSCQLVATYLWNLVLLLSVWGFVSHIALVGLYLNFLTHKMELMEIRVKMNPVKFLKLAVHADLQS